VVQITKSRSEASPLRVGYVPLTDCAPLVVAKELDLFNKHGVAVELYKEPGWATIREKICLGELDAAQAPASMVFELSLGYTGTAARCLTAFVTPHNGNAITLSNKLWEMGVRDGASLAKVVKANPSRRFTFAGVLKYSSQNYLMRHWLLSHGIVPDQDVTIMVVPPPQVHGCLKNGYLDGYCVAEPWSSVGLLEGIGWCTTLTSDFAPMHPEKVFMMTEASHTEDEDRHVALLRALWDASAYCDDPANRHELSELLARPDYVDVPQAALDNALIGPFDMGMGETTSATDAIVFHRYDVNRPTAQKAAWVLDEIALHKLQPEFQRPDRNEISRCFREDIFDQMIASLSTAKPTRSQHEPEVLT